MGNIAVPTLMFATLGIVFLIVLILYVRHMRKPQNRHPMEDQHERNIGEIRRGDPPAS